MAERTIAARIDAWEREGIIDAGTAERLRAAEAVDDRPTAIGGIFGPGVAIAEMFAYIGAGFVLGAWHAFAARFGLEDGDLERTAQFAVPGVALAVAGFILARGSERQRRSAGVAFALSAGHLGWTAFALVAPTLGGSEPVTSLVAALAFLAAGAWFRLAVPSLVTHGLGLAGITVAAAALLGWLGDLLLPPGTTEQALGERTRAVALLVLQAAVWIVTAVGIGLLGLAEASAAGVAARRRAALTRAWAGFVVVIGLAVALTGQYPPNALFERERILEPILADLLLFGLAAILIERAFRRETGAYVVPAGLAVMIGLTDLNAAYVAPASGIEVALLLEGLILLGAGLVFDRLRRRIGPTPAGAEPLPAGDDGDGEQAVILAEESRTLPDG